ncbi:MAG: class I SAM-dependent rRNA methyltransferase [bacterium]|nr:class I SAM-dependent rRNA methyltransferase [bacterium]
MTMSSSKEFPAVILKHGAESRVFGGHLWVFSNELADGFQTLAPGEFVRVLDSRGRFYGIGSVNPHSLISVRLFSRADVGIDRGFVFGRLNASYAMRERVCGDARVSRLVFSEADGLPGVIVDRFDGMTVYQTLTAGAERIKPFVIEWIHERLNPKVIVQANDSSMRQIEGLGMERGVVFGELDSMYEFEQDGLRLISDPVLGQKTGYFLDQRLNRKLMQTMLRGRETFLDLFCYSGAFGLYALRAGAQQVTFVDGSERALDLARQIVQSNSYLDRARYVKADIFEWLKDSGEQYDVVSVDPPALAKSRSKATIALRAYRDLNARAMKWVSPGGLLLTSSCSGLVSRVNWRKSLEEAAFKSRRDVRFLAFGTQAPDHPVLAAMPETEYLKFAVAQVL